MYRHNAFDQPIGPALPDWQGRSRPTRVTLLGRFCRLEPLNAARHADALFAAYREAPDGRDWTYMTAGPFATLSEYRDYCQRVAQLEDPIHFAVIDLSTGAAVGTLSLMRIDPTNAVIEVGNVAFSRLMKRTPISTEAQFLLMRYVFETLKYRRYEWKCDNANAPSKRAAQRLGFCFEGIFRQAVVYRERSRDTAWFSIIDSEWPLLSGVFASWLSAGNFDAAGMQQETMEALRAKAMQHG